MYINGKKSTGEYFINKSNIKHNKKYNYEKVIYINSHTDVIITCPLHGDFEQVPYSHSNNGEGCPKCGKISMGRAQSKTQSKVIKQFNKIHNKYYGYTKVKYIRAKDKVIITCPIHGDFEQTPNSHLGGQGCRKCGLIRSANLNRKGGIIFITEAKIVHNGKYTYENVVYIKNKLKVKITCPEHGDFEQVPNAHLSGQGCPKCKSSRGELKVIKYLHANNIKFLQEYKLIAGYHRYDFYLPELNILIEYDGIGHYKPVDYWGGVKGFKKCKENDKLKNELADLHNIPLIRIPYTKYKELDDYLLFKITVIYKFQPMIGGVIRYYKTFLDMCKDLKLPREAKQSNYKKYLKDIS